MLEQKNE